MKLLRSTLTVAAACILAFGLVQAAAATDEAYLHVRIVDENGATSSINLPASAIGDSIPGLPAGALDGGTIQIEGAEIDLYRLRQMWIALRDTEDATFVSVENNSDKLRLYKADGFLIAESRPKTAEGRTLDARIPNAAVDALLSGADNEINLEAAFETLASYGGQDLVTFAENGTSVRVWVDWDPQGD